MNRLNRVQNAPLWLGRRIRVVFAECRVHLLLLGSWLWHSKRGIVSYIRLSFIGVDDGGVRASEERLVVCRGGCTSGKDSHALILDRGTRRMHSDSLGYSLRPRPSFFVSRNVVLTTFRYHSRNSSRSPETFPSRNCRRYGIPKFLTRPHHSDRSHAYSWH